MYISAWSQLQDVNHNMNNLRWCKTFHKSLQSLSQCVCGVQICSKLFTEVCSCHRYYNIKLLMLTVNFRSSVKYWLGSVSYSSMLGKNTFLPRYWSSGPCTCVLLRIMPDIMSLLYMCIWLIYNYQRAWAEESERSQVSGRSLRVFLGHNSCPYLYPNLHYIRGTWQPPHRC